MGNILLAIVSLMSVLKSEKVVLPDTIPAAMVTCFENWIELSDSTQKEGGKVLAVITSILNVIQFEDKKVTINGGEQLLAEFIFSSYRKVPYHNVCHGIMVAYYTSLMLDDIKIKEVESSIRTKHLLILAGLLHDIGHPGYTNPACPKETTVSSLLPSEQAFCVLKVAGDKKSCKLVKEGTILEHQNIFKKDADGVIDFINHVTDVGKLFTDNFTPAKTATFYEKFCGSAEIIHSTIAHKISEMISIKDTNEKFVLISAILLTHMGSYDGDGNPLFNFQIKDILKKEPEKKEETSIRLEQDKMNIVSPYIKLVHFADIFGNGEANHDLRNMMLTRLLIEFYQEIKSGRTTFISESTDFTKFLAGQMGFFNGFVVPQTNSFDKENKIKNTFFSKTFERIEHMVKLVDTDINFGSHFPNGKDEVKIEHDKAVKERKDLDEKIFKEYVKLKDKLYPIADKTMVSVFSVI